MRQLKAESSNGETRRRLTTPVTLIAGACVLAFFGCEQPESPQPPEEGPPAIQNQDQPRPQTGEPNERRQPPRPEGTEEPAQSPQELPEGFDDLDQDGASGG